MTDMPTQVQTTFDGEVIPLLAMIQSLAKTYAGNIYRKVAGSVESVATWDANHPEVKSALNVITATASVLMPGSAAVIGTVSGGINVADHILGELGTLVAADPTVQGPMPAPSVAPVAPAPALTAT